METGYNIVLILTMIIAFAFAALIFFTSKGDAMSGGSNVRTSFKGKAGFDDMVSKMVLILGCSFMGLTILLDVFASKLSR